MSADEAVGSAPSLGQIEVDFGRAVELGELVLHYQPILELPSRSIWGVEALLRWHHASRGLLPPAEFVRLAEERGLIVPIGSWVLEQALTDGARLQQMAPPLRVVVNVSARQLASQAGLTSTVARALDATGVAPETVVLALTETASLQDVAEAIHELMDMRSLGVRLGVDDLGVGFASLDHLQQFPIDIATLHRSFIEALSRGGGKADLTARTIGLMQNLQIEPIAVGVERDEEVQALISLGCRLGQGFHLAEPAPVEQVERLLGVTQHAE